jgi:hypothetical protein
MRELEQIKKQLKKQPDGQVSLTDPGSRSMTGVAKEPERLATTFRPL